MSMNSISQRRAAILPSQMASVSHLRLILCTLVVEIDSGEDFCRWSREARFAQRARMRWGTWLRGLVGVLRNSQSWTSDGVIGVMGIHPFLSGLRSAPNHFGIGHLLLSKAPWPKLSY